MKGRDQRMLRISLHVSDSSPFIVLIVSLTSLHTVFTSIYIYIFDVKIFFTPSLIILSKLLLNSLPGTFILTTEKLYN